MAVVYFDSSALVKLVADEDGSEVAATIWDGADFALASRLAYPEVCAALAAAGRDGRLDADGQQHAAADWEQYWAAVRPVELTASIAASAGELARQHALRGADAVHLASALAVQSPDLLFAAWDHRLRSAVDAAGVALAPASLP